MSTIACGSSLPSFSADKPSTTESPRNPPDSKQQYESLYPQFKTCTGALSNDELDMHSMSLRTAATTVATASYSMASMASMADDVSETSDGGLVMDLPDELRRLSEVKKPIPCQTHSMKAGKEIFTLDTRYSLIRTIGSGAYGAVISAADSQTNENVAIKMVPRAFNDEVDAKRILREIKLLRHFEHENIVSILDMMPPQHTFVEGFNDVYIVADLMETDLHRIIYSKQALSIDHVQYFIYQLLRGLKYIHSANVIHRDLKPSNLLVNSNCDLKICDFGLARGIYDGQTHTMKGSVLLTEYVVTRWYRAPEIMLSCHKYSKPVDIWSVGCIFAELILRKPLFPGDDYIDQLTIICEKLGKMPEEDLDFVTSEKAKRFMRKLPEKTSPSLSRLFPGQGSSALDLMKRLLQIHPRKRITVEKALAHPFFAHLHSLKDEPAAESLFDFSFEDEKLDRTKLKELIWEEIGHFRPSCLPVAPRKYGAKLHEA